MMDWLILLLIPLCGLLDRIRGGWRPMGQWANYPAKFGYGLVLGALLGLPWQWWPAVSFLWWLGEKPGYGYPLGWAVTGIPTPIRKPEAKPEWWQFWFLKSQPWPSLIVRGAMWGAPCLLLYYWQPDVLGLVVAGALGMPAGALLERQFTSRWPASGEAWRGLIIGAFCAAVSL